MITDFDPAGSDEKGNAVAIQPDGKIVVAGHNQAPDFALARYEGLAVGSTTTDLKSSANPSVVGQVVVFTATVTGGGGGTPTGSVEFFHHVSKGTYPLNNGVATWTSPIEDMIVTTHPITAMYKGDANFTASTSAILIQIVNPAKVYLPLIRK